MASTGRSLSSSANVPSQEKSRFEQQRDTLVSEIAVSLEHVLQNLNSFNRSLEGIIAVGNEFSSVEALWSQFETVMGKLPETEEDKNTSSASDHDSDELDTTITEDGKL